MTPSIILVRKEAILNGRITAAPETLFHPTCTNASADRVIRAPRFKENMNSDLQESNENDQ